MELALAHYRPQPGLDAPLAPSLDSASTLVVAFGATGLDADAAVFEELAAAYPRSVIVGCSTAGEIHGTRLSDDTLSVAAVRFSTTRLALAIARVSQASDSFGAARRIAEELASPDLRGVFVLSDGLHVNGSELVRGLSATLGAAVPVTGGLAADGNRFARTWVLHGSRPEPGVVAGVGFYGDRVRIGHGSRGGWDHFGPDRLVTRATGNVLFELDGNPALELYKRYLGERAHGLPATALLFPLALRSADPGGERLVRTVLGIDEVEQSMTFAGEIPQGSHVQLMRANLERLIQGASLAAGSGALGHDGASPTLAIAISCVGRRLVLGERSEEEIEATLDALPSGTRQVGFYSYGEISPHAAGACDLHNQTMTLTTISEAA